MAAMNNPNTLNNCKCLYVPKGAAREYAAVACNFYRGCPYQCKYCYNRKGLGAGMLGIGRVVMASKFTSPRYRPKGFIDLSPENFAMRTFVQEVKDHVDLLRSTGIFMSFITDPMLSETHALTLRAACFCARLQIPVTILTKSTMPFRLLDPWFASPASTGDESIRDFVAFGFTLTGRDDVERGAAIRFSSNRERIKAMRRLKELGFKTWASIEPVVDFPSSYAMVRDSLPFCDHYKIGLMSKRGKDFPPYDPEECEDFVLAIDSLLTETHAGKSPGHQIRAYWKESVRNFMDGREAVQGVFALSPTSVGRDWNLFNANP